MRRIFSLFFSIAMLLSVTSYQQSKKDFNVIAYYSGGLAQLDSFDVTKISHIIYCFGHLKDNRFHINTARDTAMITKMVALKKKNPALKVMVSLGGWGGCKTCSEIFSTAENRRAFAESVKKLIVYFKADGIDLDWEYPSITGYPGHRFAAEDKNNFTQLLRQLRKTLGQKQQLSFAAGGFQNFLDSAVEWKEVIKYVDFINLMTYDLINGYSTVTGHHTALYSLPQQHESTDNAVTWLLKSGIPANKLVIGAAFYGRSWENVPATDNGLYQPGKFKSFVAFKRFPQEMSQEKGYTYFWDERAKAPYLYNAERKEFVTFDDKRSIGLKARYVAGKKLNGIMFWELSLDTFNDGLLHTIDSVKHGSSFHAIIKK